MAGSIVDGSTHRFAHVEQSWKVVPLKTSEQPDAERHVALQSATLADCAPMTQPIWQLGCCQPETLPVQHAPLLMQRVVQSAAPEADAADTSSSVAAAVRATAETARIDRILGVGRNGRPRADPMAETLRGCFAYLARPSAIVAVQNAMKRGCVDDQQECGYG